MIGKSRRSFSLHKRRDNPPRLAELKTWLLQSLSCALALLCFGNASHAQIDVEYEPETPHHISIVVGGTYVVEPDELGFTVGVDYEYRLNRLIGLGFVVERAFGEIDSTTVLGVADIHVWRGFAFQVGPGFERIDGETFALGRLGGLYEFEVGSGFTIAPQAHYDISGGEDAIVFGIAFGVAF
ncbi:MAG: hypothetical protein AAGF15_06950 [Pseudomonadota bacterium]